MEVLIHIFFYWDLKVRMKEFYQYISFVEL